MRFESFKLGAKCWLQSLNQCLSPHPWPACWSMTLQNPDTTGHTYIQETTYQIRSDSPLCAKSECPRLPVWSMLLKKKKYPMKFLCENSAQFLPRVCSVDQIPARCWRFGPSRRQVRPPARLQDCFREQPEPMEGGSPGQVLCFKAVQTAACPTHLAFLQASCNNFFLL